MWHYPAGVGGGDADSGAAAHGLQGTLRGPRFKPCLPTQGPQVFRIDQHEELAQKRELREQARREWQAAKVAKAAGQPGLPLRQPAAEAAGDKQLNGGGSANGEANTPSSEGPKPAPLSAGTAAAHASSRQWCGAERWCAGLRRRGSSRGGGGPSGRLLERQEARLVHPPGYYKYLAW